MNLSEVDGQRALARRPERETAAGARRLPAHTVSELLIPTSYAIDLAEGRSPGHAQRVAYITTSIAGVLGLETSVRLACCYAGLLHDIGVIIAGTGLSDYVRGDERLLFASLPVLTPEEAATGASDLQGVVVDRLVEHTIHGARSAQELTLPQESIKGIASHHENWNGTGYPHGLNGRDIPLVGRLVSLADQVECMISQASPLQARRNLPAWLMRLSGTVADPEAVQAFRVLSNGDEFWLGLFSPDMTVELAALCMNQREQKGARLLAFADTFSQLVDSRFSFMLGVSAKVARLAESIGRKAGLSDMHVRQLRIAALFHDIGQLAVSERVLAKPGILSVEEHDLLRDHPHYSRDVVVGISGLTEVAEWVAAHHERPDGKGYPEGRTGDEIPFESRVLAVADAYVAITSDRPHRPRAETAEAVRRLRAAAGTQLDGEIVELFVNKVLG